MPRKHSFLWKAAKPAFTLIEILTVVAIIGLVAITIIGLQPGNPRGLDDACRIAATEFQVARGKAVLGANPDREPDLNKRYNIRSAVLILNNKDDPDRHLRYIVPVVGGTDDESKTDLADYYWYAVGDSAGTLLPQGVYYIPPTESISSRSLANPLEGGNEVTYEPTTEPGGKPFGAGGQRWFVYYYDSNGQTYMSKATFMLGEGVYNAVDGVRFTESTPVAGFAITRNGSIIYTRDIDEIEAANQE